MKQALRRAGMFLPYFLLVLGLLLMFVIATVLMSGNASADPATHSGRDRMFLSLLENAGISFKNPESVIAEAHTICRQLDGGQWTKQDVVDIAVSIKESNPSMELKDIGSLIGAALTTYCPGNIPDWFYDEVMNGQVDPGDIKPMRPQNGEQPA